VSRSRSRRRRPMPCRRRRCSPSTTSGRRSARRS